MKKKKNKDELIVSGYPPYPKNEDLYAKMKVETEINPEDTARKKINSAEVTANHKSFEEDKTGNDLDVPGSELDDPNEEIGSEDEENNYYSLGGDRHNDLEEN